MNSFWNRANALVTYFMLVAGVLAGLTAFTDIAQTPQLPEVKAEIRHIKLVKNRQGNDQVGLAVRLTADLTPYWTWNTKLIFVFLHIDYATPVNAVNQVTVWDDILQSRRRAIIRGKDIRQEYTFHDQGAHMRGTPVNVTLSWNVVPRVGALRTFSQSLLAGRMPADYQTEWVAWQSWDR